MLKKNLKVKIGSKYAYRMSYERKIGMVGRIVEGPYRRGNAYGIKEPYDMYVVAFSAYGGDKWEIHKEDIIPLTAITNKQSKHLLDKER